MGDLVDNEQEPAALHVPMGRRRFLQGTAFAGLSGLASLRGLKDLAHSALGGSSNGSGLTLLSHKSVPIPKSLKAGVEQAQALLRREGLNVPLGPATRARAVVDGNRRTATSFSSNTGEVGFRHGTIVAMVPDPSVGSPTVQAAVTEWGPGNYLKRLHFYEWHDGQMRHQATFEQGPNGFSVSIPTSGSADAATFEGSTQVLAQFQARATSFAEDPVGPCCFCMHAHKDELEWVCEKVAAVVCAIFCLFGITCGPCVITGIITCGLQETDCYSACSFCEGTEMCEQSECDNPCTSCACCDP